MQSKLKFETKYFTLILCSFAIKEARPLGIRRSKRSGHYVMNYQVSKKSEVATAPVSVH